MLWKLAQEARHNHIAHGCAVRLHEKLVGLD